MAGRRDNILQRIVRLVFDRAAAERTKSQAQNTATGIDRALGKLKTTALALGAAFGAAFAVRRLIDFGRAAVAEATKAEQSWTRLAQSVQNAGGSFASVEKAVRLAATTLQDTSRFGDEEFADTMSEIVQISGNVARGFDGVQIAADLAAAKQIDLRTAAQLVGRAMIGETALLKRYGIIVEEGADAVETMRAQFAGFAEREGRTFGGRIAMLNNAWGDFKEALGEALIEAGSGTSVIDTLTGAVKQLTQAIEDAKPLFAFFARFIEDFTRSSIKLATDLGRLGSAFRRFWIWDKDALDARDMALDAIDMVRKRNREREAEEQRAALVTQAAEEAKRIAAEKAAEATAKAAEEARKAAEERERQIAAEINAIETGRRLGLLSADDKARARQLEADIVTEIQRGNLSLERRIELEQRRAALQATTLSRPPLPGLAPVGTGQIQSISPEQNQQIIAGFPDRDEDFQQRVEERLEGLQNVKSAALAASAAMQSGFQDAFGLLFQDLDNFGQFAVGIFQSIAVGVIGGIAQMARQKSAENVVWAIENVAKGLAAASNPLTAGFAAGYFESAATHGAAAVAWAALAGAAGAAGGAISGGRNTSNAFATPLGGRDGDSRPFSGEVGGEITIFLEGEYFDHRNPNVVRVVKESVRQAEERHPGRTVKVRVR